MWACAAALVLAGCGEDPRLEGSLIEFVDLRYRRAEALLTEEEVSVRFVSPEGSGEDTVLKVTARLAGILFEPNTEIDLAEPVDDGGVPRGSVTRSVLTETARSFPPIGRGTLLFRSGVAGGGVTSGTFHVTFANGTHVYSGRTVFGDFEAAVP